jgi:hypothetical protein
MSPTKLEAVPGTSRREGRTRPIGSRRARPVAAVAGQRVQAVRRERDHVGPDAVDVGDLEVDAPGESSRGTGAGRMARRDLLALQADQILAPVGSEQQRRARR